MPRTQLERVWVLGGVIVALLMVLIGYVMFISPQKSDTSSAQAQVSSARLVNQRLESRIVALRGEGSKLDQYQREIAAAQLALPSTSGLPDFLRTLQSIGTVTHADVSSLTVGAPADVTTVAGATRPAGASAAASAASVNGARVYALPITASVSGTPAELDQFLTQLQSVQPRAVLISQLAESSSAGTTGASAAGSSNGGSVQLTMQAFVAPSSAAERAQLSAASGK